MKVRTFRRSPSVFLHWLNVTVRITIRHVSVMEDQYLGLSNEIQSPLSFCNTKVSVYVCIM